MAFTSNSAAGSPMADINVTPLVDVMLVLLIIFMVTAPIMSYPIDVNLPQRTTTPPPPTAPREPIRLRIDASGQIYWNEAPQPITALRGMMDRKSGATGHDESEISSGMLYATGLVAGGALTGVGIAALQGWRVGPGRSMAQQILDSVGIHGWEKLGATADLIGVAMFTGLCILLVRAAKEKLEA